MDKYDYSEIDIDKLLLQLGTDPHYKGFYYTEYALMILKEDMESLFSITKCIYPVIAKKFHTTDKTVDRSLRTMSEVAWEENPQLIQKLSGRDLHRRPTVTQFLAILHLQLTKHIVNIK